MALVCDRLGVILNVLENDFPIDNKEMVGKPLPAIFGSTSLPKALGFLATVQEQGRFFDCELVLEVCTGPTLLHFSGLSFEHGFFVVAARDRMAIRGLFEGMIRTSRDRADPTPRELSAVAVSQGHARMEMDVFSQLTTMNNELVTLGREMQKKNAELRRLNEEVEKLARFDHLTKLLNRRGFFELGEREVAAAHRFSKPLVALMVDVDHFKKLNDTYGHAAGDEALLQIAGCFARNVRGVDLLGRYGGEEFVLLLTESSLRDGEVSAERLRAAIHELRLDVAGTSLFATVSVGVAALQPDTTKLTELLDRADKALYRAKEGGRNQVCVSAGA